MESHKRTLGILYIISSALHFFGMLIVGLVMTFVIALIRGDGAYDEGAVPEIIVLLMTYLPFVIFILLVMPSLIAGIGLLANQSWALVLAMIVGCFKLFSPPLGTALGIYALWVYFEDKKIQDAAILQNRPPDVNL